MAKRIGKVKSFNAERKTGVLTTIGGAELRFTCPAKALAPGQVVAFEMVADGSSSVEARAEPLANARLERRRVGGRRADDVSSAD